MSKQKITDDIRQAVRAQLTAAPKRSERAKHKTVRTTAGLWARPFASDALGVSPGQVEEARAALRQHGVTADFDEQGRCVVTSDKQYREVAKACGMWTGAHGFGQRNEDGHKILTGRDQQRARDEFRRQVERGDYDGLF